MRKWKQTLAITAVAAMMGIVAGCASKEAETTAAPTEAATEAVEESMAEDDMTVKQPETIDEREMVSTDSPYGNPVMDIPRMFEDMSSILGEDDDKTIFLLGEGTTAVKDEDGTVSSRQYMMKLMDHPTTTDVFYNEGKVVEIQMVLEEAELEASRKQLEESLKLEGTPKEAANDGGTIQSVLWELPDCIVELSETYGTISIRVTPIL